MIDAVTLKSDGSTTQLGDVSALALDAPSVVTLGFGPEEVARFDKVGNDLVLLLKDGTTVTITSFFIVHDDGRNEIVFVDENEVVWWGQYDEPWHSFHIAEIEHEIIPAAIAIPGLAPILAVIAGIGLASGLAAGGSDDDNDEDVDSGVPLLAADESATAVEAGVTEGSNDAEDGTPEAGGNVLTVASGTGLSVIAVQFGDTEGVIGQQLVGEFGSLLLEEDGSYTYTLDNADADTQGLGAGETAQEVFTYTISDADGNTDTATLTVTVVGANDTPIISGVDTGAVEEDGVEAATGQLEVTDWDAGDTHTWSVNGDPEGDYGAFNVGQDGTWAYDLDSSAAAVQALGVGETLTETFVVLVTDSAGATDEQTVTITITGSNDAPVIDVENSVLTGALTEVTDLADNENNDVLTVSGSIAYSDPDANDAAPTVTVAPVVDDGSYLGDITLTPAVGGAIGWTFEADDSVLDSLPEGAVLTQEYVVTVTDDAGAVTTETVTITLVGKNDAPETTDDASLIAVGDTAVLDVTANDTDADTGEAANLTVSAVDGQPISVGNPVTLSDGSGTVSIDENGVLSFEPAPGFTGPVTISYTVDDGSGADNAATNGNWVVAVVDAVISDNASQGAPDTGDDVLASVDDLTAVAITGQTAVGGTITGVTVSDGTTTLIIPLDELVINPDGTYEIPADLSDLLDGTLTVEVSHEDADGNVAITTDTILKDTATAVSIDPITIVDGQVPVLTGTAQPGDTLTLTIDGVGTVEVEVSEDGTWSYTPETPLNTSELTVVATATDPYGNVATDLRQVAGFPAQSIILSEAGLPDGTDLASGSDTVQDTLNIGTTDGGIEQVTIDGEVITLAQLTDIDNTPIPPIETELGTLTVTGYDPETGTLTYDFVIGENSLENQNPDGVDAAEDVRTETIQISVTDADGDTRVSMLEVDVTDDVPTVEVNPDSTASLTTSDGTFSTDPSQSFADLFDIDTGADGPAETSAIVYGFQIPSEGVDSGLVDSDTDEPILLFTDEDGNVVGRIGGVDGPVALAVSVDPTTGVVTLDQQRPVTNPAGNDDAVNITDDAILLTATVVDGDGDTVTEVAPIGTRLTLTDDVPTAVDDVASLASGDLGPVTGNLITGAGTDTEGADGATVTGVTFGATTVVVPATGTTTIDGDYGTLTVAADGSYSYTRDAGTAGGVDDVFSYVLTDSDGDASVADLTVSLGDSPVSFADLDDATVTGADGVVYESQLPTIGSGVGGTSSTVSGSFTVTSFDGIDALTISAGGTTISVVDDNVAATTPLVLTSALGSTLTITGYDAATGEVSYTYALAAGETHADDTSRDNLLDTFALSLTDVDGDVATASLSIHVVDDLPVVEAVPTFVVELTVTDADLGTNASASFAGLFDIDHGADLADATAGTVYSLEVSAEGVDSGLVDEATGDAILLYVEGGVVVGRVADQSGPVAFNVSVAADGTVTLDQTRALDHPTADVADTLSIATGAISLRATVQDGDGDTATEALAIGGRLSFVDDLPTTGLADSGATAPVLATQDGDTLTGSDTASADFSGVFTLTNDLGNDGGADVDAEVLTHTLSLQGGATSVASGLTSEGDAVTLHLIGGVVTASTEADAADVDAANTVFTIATDAAGTVTLTQSQPIDHADTMSSSEVTALAADLVVLTASSAVEDGDGDTATASASANIGDSFTFTDDGPTTGTTPNTAVDEADLRAGGTLTASGDIVVDFGADLTPTTASFDAAQTALAALDLESDGVPLVYVITDGLITATAGGATVFTVTLTQPTAGNGYTPSYAYVQSEVLDHGATGTDVLSLPFAFTIEDGDGDTASDSFAVVVTDDVPTAVDDVASLASGDLGPVTGNLITGAGTDTEGADGATVTGVTFGATTVVVPATGTTTIDGDYGTLTVAADGSYSYTRDAGTAGGVDDVFSYVLTDSDGDASVADLTVSLGDSPVSFADLDDATVTGADGVVYESQLPTIGSGVGGTSSTVSGSFTVTSFDGIDALTISAGGTTISVVDDNVAATTPLVLTSALGSTLTITGYDAATGEVSYTYALAAGETHADDTSRDNLLDTFALSLTDVDGDVATASLSIHVVDDLPVVEAVPTFVVELTVTDADLGTNASASFAGLFDIDHGADLADATAGTVYSLEVSAEGVDSGLVDEATGDAILLYVEGGVVVGRVADQSGPVAFNVSVAADGTVTLDQTRALDHPTADVADTLSIATGAISLRATVQDGDGDTATEALAIGGRLSFVDDLPTTGLADSGATAPVLATQDGDTLTGSDTASADFSGVFTLTNDLGNDGGADVDAEVLTHTLSLQGGATSVASGLTSEGDAVTLHLIGGVVTASTEADAADVDAANTVFTIATDAAGTVTLTQSQPIDHADTMSSSEVTALAADLVVLTASSAVEDGDGDTATASGQRQHRRQLYLHGRWPNHRHDAEHSSG